MVITTCPRCKQEFEAPDSVKCMGVIISVQTCFDCARLLMQERVKREFEETVRSSSIPQGLVDKAGEHSKEMLVDWKACLEHIQSGRSLWFTGSKGTGKSVTAVMIALALLKRRCGVRYVTEVELIRHFGERSDSNLFWRDCNAHVVLLDDFGLTPTAHASLNEFIDCRYRKALPVIATDNLGPAALAKMEGYDRAVSRLLDMTQPMGPQFFNGPDRRKR